MLLQQTPHIPAGCLTIPRDQISLDDDAWSLEELRTWAALSLLPETALEVGRQERYLRHDFQTALLKSIGMTPYAKLFRAQWIKLEFSITADEHATLRVHLLPDDVLRGTVDRSNTTLLKARQVILSGLDYSKSAWNGKPESTRSGSPTLYDPGHDEADKDSSLLQLFNRIPSPQPNPEIVFDEYSKDAMHDLLESKIPGLSTELYPYQRRSAAVMLQKEVQPGNVLDPRLLHVRDQNGSAWYTDPVAGTVLLEPRLYDGISGGILAEEMGAGKTIICLALILATKRLPTAPPSLYRGGGEVPIRAGIASLAEMAASCATRNAVPWKTYFDIYKTQLGFDFAKCTEVLEENPGYYYVPAPEPRRGGRHPDYYMEQPKKIFLSNASLVVVPNNLVDQWKQEIQKHTDDLNVLVVVKDDEIPPYKALLKYDMILFSQSRFEQLGKHFGGISECSLSQLHFKRCIVDEGHKLGHSRIGHKSNLLIILDALSFSARWIVTGTPSQGLFGVDSTKSNGDAAGIEDGHSRAHVGKTVRDTSIEMEKKDLERIGSIAALYLKARPWANTTTETGDTLADWSVYLMLPKHNAKSRGRWDCLKSTLNSLIIRHQLCEVGDLLPPVDEKIVMLDGSYQDRLSLNLFSMMIIFNSVQSQRTDMDYFFHPKQKQSLMQIVYNLKQTSFFGGSFFNSAEIGKSVETAEEFLREKKVAISPEDEMLLQDAIRLGHVAMENKLRNLSNEFHEMPVCVKDFPGGAGRSWSLGGEVDGNEAVSTSASLLLALQKLVHNSAKESETLNSLLNGGLIEEGLKERHKILTQTTEKPPTSKDLASQTLAGNTKLGKDRPRKSRSHRLDNTISTNKLTADAFSGPLKSTRITSTVSAKMSYLVDGIVKHQEEEKIIVFYENENVAWYLASILDVLQIEHLIYAKGLTTERRAQYVNTFHYNPRFRVLLMDLSQAAFGLDMKAASRIYFINPVLNPQVEAQAIGRVRRISQQKPVSVETLVLRGSIDEVLLERKRHMTQAEHRQVKSILDIRPIYNWIKNASIVPGPNIGDDDASQMSALQTSHYVFGRGFGKTLHPDDGLIIGQPPSLGNKHAEQTQPTTAVENGTKRSHEVGPGKESDAMGQNGIAEAQDLANRPARRVRFAADSDEE